MTSLFCQTAATDSEEDSDEYDSSEEKPTVTAPMVKDRKEPCWDFEKHLREAVSHLSDPKESEFATELLLFFQDFSPTTYC